MTGFCPARRSSRATFHRYVIDANRAAGRREPLSGPEHNRPLPGDGFRRARPIYGTARRPMPTRSSAERARLPRALPRGACRRDRPGPRPRTGWRSSTTATRSARASRSCSRAGCRTSTSARTMATPAHQRWRPPSRAICAGAKGFTQRPERPLQGRLDHAPLRPAGGQASTRSRWSSPSRPTCDRSAALRLRRGEGRPPRARPRALSSRRSPTSPSHSGGSP